MNLTFFGLFFRLPLSWIHFWAKILYCKFKINSNFKVWVNKLTKSEFINKNIQIIHVPGWEFSKAAREQTPECLCLSITTFSAIRALQGIPTKTFTFKTAKSIFSVTFSTKNYKEQAKHNSCSKPTTSTAIPKSLIWPSKSTKTQISSLLKKATKSKS